MGRKVEPTDKIFFNGKTHGGVFLNGKEHKEGWMVVDGELQCVWRKNGDFFYKNKMALVYKFLIKWDVYRSNGLMNEHGYSEIVMDTGGGERIGYHGDKNEYDTLINEYEYLYCIIDTSEEKYIPKLFFKTKEYYLSYNILVSQIGSRYRASVAARTEGNISSYSSGLRVERTSQFTSQVHSPYGGTYESPIVVMSKRATHPDFKSIPEMLYVTDIDNTYTPIYIIETDENNTKISSVETMPKRDDPFVYLSRKHVLSSLKNNNLVYKDDNEIDIKYNTKDVKSFTADRITNEFYKNVEYEVNNAIGIIHIYGLQIVDGELIRNDMESTIEYYRSIYKVINIQYGSEHVFYSNNKKEYLPSQVYDYVFDKIGNSILEYYNNCSIYENDNITHEIINNSYCIIIYNILEIENGNYPVSSFITSCCGNNINGKFICYDKYSENFMIKDSRYLISDFHNALIPGNNHYYSTTPSGKYGEILGGYQAFLYRPYIDDPGNKVIDAVDHENVRYVFINKSSFAHDVTTKEQELFNMYLYDLNNNERKKIFGNSNFVTEIENVKKYRFNISEDKYARKPDDIHWFVNYIKCLELSELYLSNEEYSYFINKYDTSDIVVQEHNLLHFGLGYYSVYTFNEPEFKRCKNYLGKFKYYHNYENYIIENSPDIDDVCIFNTDGVNVVKNDVGFLLNNLNSDGPFYIQNSLLDYDVSSLVSFVINGKIIFNAIFELKDCVLRKYDEHKDTYERISSEKNLKVSQIYISDGDNYFKTFGYADYATFINEDELRTITNILEYDGKYYIYTTKGIFTVNDVYSIADFKKWTLVNNSKKIKIRMDEKFIDLDIPKMRFFRSEWDSIFYDNTSNRSKYYSAIGKCGSYYFYIDNLECMESENNYILTEKEMEKYKDVPSIDGYLIQTGRVTNTTYNRWNPDIKGYEKVPAKKFETLAEYIDGSIDKPIYEEYET